MLNFQLSSEESMLVEAINRFADKKLRAHFRDAEEDGVIPEEVLKTGWELGLVASGIPEVFGGFGEYSVVTNALAVEEMAFGDLAITLNIMLPGVVAIPIMLMGSERQKQVLLPLFCKEKSPNFSAALTEPEILFDPRALKTTAIRDGDDYILSGNKSLVPLAESAEKFLIYAAEDGITQAFFVDFDNPGLELRNKEKLMGIRALPTYGLTLNECRISKSNKLGEDAGIQFDALLNHSRVALAAAAVGVARAAYEYAREYAKVRVQFDEPIAHRQSIAFMLAEMAIEVDASRLMVWETAWKLDQGLDALKDALVMKQYVDQAAVTVTDRAVQILGGYGYIREYPTELWLRNARGFSSFEGLAMI